MADVIMSSVSNNITALIFGERYSHDDPRRHFLNPQLMMISRNASFASAVDFLPAVWKLLSYSSLSKPSLFRQYMAGLLDFIRQVPEPYTKCTERTAHFLSTTYKSRAHFYSNDCDIWDLITISVLYPLG